MHATQAGTSSPQPPEMHQKLKIFAEPLSRQMMSRFNVAFSLMSIIPLLTVFYLITVRFFSIAILEGMNGVYFLLALVIALVGLLAGRQVIRDIISKLVEANDKLAKLNDQQAAFVGNVAHEFRSPLAVFKASLDNLADGLYGDLTQDQQEPVSMCLRETNRLTRLVGDLLDLTNMEAGKLPMVKKEVVLQDTLRAVEQMFTGLLKKRNLTLTMDLPQTPAQLVGDPDRLQQVFVNLMANAIKFTQTGGITVQLTQNGDAVQIKLEDTGPGISPEDLSRIFDKFERVSSTEEGSGLGLPIARDIVGLHHGKIWVESEVGRGSRFFVRLPMKGAPAADD